MRTRAALAVVLVVFGFGLLVSCGDGGAGGEPAATAAPTAEPTAAPADMPAPTAAPTEPAVEAPDAAPVTLEPGVALLNEGTLDLTIAPRGSSEVDPLALVGDEAVACAELAVAFSWQVQDPYPPEGVQFRVTGTRMGATVDLGVGPAGTSTVGCFGISFINDSGFAVSVQVRYAAGRLEG